MSFGFWAYLAGLVISLALGFSGLELVFSLIILAALGLIVGFMNLKGDSEHLFSLFVLTAVFWIAHYLSGSAFRTLGAGADSLSTIFLNLLLFSVFVTLVLAFKNLYDSAHASSGSFGKGAGTKQALRVRRVA